MIRNPLGAAAPVALALVLVTTACGAGGQTETADGVASLGVAEDGAASSNDNPVDDGEGQRADVDAPEDPELAYARYEECMTDAGFDFGSVIGGDGDEGGTIQVEELELDGEADPQLQEGFDGNFEEEFRKIEEECGKHLANVDAGFDLSPEQEAALNDAQLAWTECMRDAGIDVPEPEEGSGGVMVFEAGGDGSDPQSGGFDDSDFDFEAFEQAAGECDTHFDEIEGLGDEADREES